MPKKKTHEEFIKEVWYLVGEEYIVLDTYINSSTKIMIKHNNESCNFHTYTVVPNNFVKPNGTRCPECARVADSLNKRKTHEEFVSEVINLVGEEYEFLTKYKDKKTPIKTMHLHCKYVWSPTPDDLLTWLKKGNTVCPKCNNCIKLTTETFKERVKHLVGDEYSVLGEYVNSKVTIRMRHNNDLCGNYEYDVTPNGFSRGNRCPKCGGNIDRDTALYKKEVYDLVGKEYDVLGEYLKSDISILMRHNCNECNNYEFPMRPNSFLSRGQRCPKCAGRVKKTVEEFIEAVYSLVGNEYTVIGEYVDTQTPIEMRHNSESCNFYTYMVRPINFTGTEQNRCPKCKMPKGEKRIGKWLDDCQINYVPQKGFSGLVGVGGGNLSYDFYLPEHTLLIEYQGKFHDGSGGDYTRVNLGKQQEHDRRKKEYAEKNGINLLEIWYWDFDNIERILQELKL